MAQASVSVLLPIHNAAQHLPACLASLASQTLAEHEVVAVDDGSTDESPAILRQHARSDPRLRIVTLPRSGLVAALNCGLEAATGTFLARMDADDTADPRRLELQVARLQSDPTVDILGSCVSLAGEIPGDNAGMRAYVRWTNELLTHEAMLRERFVDAPLIHPSVMLRRVTLQALGGYRAFEGPEDYDLWLRAAERGLRFAKLSLTLLAWRDGPGRLTRTDPRYSAEAFQRLKLEALRRGPLAPGRPVVIWGAGPIGKGWGRALAQLGHRVVAFVEVAPRKLGQTIGGARVVDVEAAGAFRGPLHLAAVGQPGARRRICAAARQLGLADEQDLVALA